MKFQIISIGKIKNKNLLFEIENLKKRIQRIEFIELKEIKNNKDIEIIKKEEEKAFEKYIINENFNILLTEKGKEFSTLDFYKMLKKIKDKKIVFFISGAFGPSKDLIENPNIHLKLSLSKMIFTHEQAKYMLLEQIYRAQCFEKNIPYTK